MRVLLLLGTGVLAGLLIGHTPLMRDGFLSPAASGHPVQMQVVDRRLKGDRLSPDASAGRAALAHRPAQQNAVAKRLHPAEQGCEPAFSPELHPELRDVLRDCQT